MLSYSDDIKIPGTLLVFRICTKFVVRVFPYAMKTSVFIFLFLLVSSLSSVMDSGAKSGVPAAAAVRQTAECFLAGFKYGDCVATETVRTAVPCPVRSLRKPVEGPQRVSGGDRDVCSGRHFPLAQGCCTKYVVSSLLRGGQTALPFHRADYLRFGVLVI